MQNGSVSMTKQQYFDMCEQLGSEPVDSEIPVEFNDFAIEAQLALSIYRMLRDEWEFINGNYLGKNLNGIFELFDVYEIDARDKKFYLELIYMIDSIRIDEIRNTKQIEKPAT
jgi:hypothetical protein